MSFARHGCLFYTNYLCLNVAPVFLRHSPPRSRFGQAHAVLLEERLQQTLEREAALNAELETQRDSAHKGEQRASMAESFAARAHAAAAAQVRSF